MKKCYEVTMTAVTAVIIIFVIHFLFVAWDREEDKRVLTDRSFTQYTTEAK